MIKFIKKFDGLPESKRFFTFSVICLVIGFVSSFTNYLPSVTPSENFGIGILMTGGFLYIVSEIFKSIERTGRKLLYIINKLGVEDNWSKQFDWECENMDKLREERLL